MRLYGTTTSPFVRRVRIVATELGIPFELVDCATEAGQAELRRVTPIWKVPTVVLGSGEAEETIWDSRAIIERLLAIHGPGPLRPSPEPGTAEHARELCLCNAIDGALDSGINLLYMHRDNIEPEHSSYLRKQRDRLDNALGWVEARLHGTSFDPSDPRIGLPEIALLTALDWFVFRERYPVHSRPRLVEFARAHADRPSVRSTMPA